MMLLPAVVDTVDPVDVNGLVGRVSGGTSVGEVGATAF